MPIVNQVVTPVNTINTVGNTGFRPVDGEWELFDAPVKESTAYAGQIAMRWEISSNTTTGKLVAGSTNSGVNSVGADFFGILVAPVRSTDPDYATAFKKKSFFIPRWPRSRAVATIGAGTFTTADVGKTVAIHSDAASIACDTAGLGCRIVEYIDSTTALVEFSCPTTQTA